MTNDELAGSIVALALALKLLTEEVQLMNIRLAVCEAALDVR